MNFSGIKLHIRIVVAPVTIVLVDILIYSKN